MLAGSRLKPISAMVRVRNEEEFLAASIHSIAAVVDEVVIIDNASTDGTQEVIRTLVRELPCVRWASYPHRLARAGQENRDAVREGDRALDRRLSTLNNRSLRECRYPFVLKWDGDMVAGNTFASAVAEWRSGPYLSMRFMGLNLHEDRVHLLGARSYDPAVVGRPLSGDRVPGWALRMTYCDTELRVFPHFLAWFDDSKWWWCSSLRSPFRFRFGRVSGRLANWYRLDVANPLYLHLKYWKRFPHTNHSPDLEAMIRNNTAVGPPIPEEWRGVLAERGLLGGT